MIDAIQMELERKKQQRAIVASVKVDGVRYKGLNVYENEEGKLDVFIPHTSTLPSSIRSEVKKALIGRYMTMIRIV